ncbi:hypothetical protein L7F22_022799 [Adiantum nelumboides]|nr:hypothetical protein [Adiantum nelumboides]
MLTVFHEVFEDGGPPSLTDADHKKLVIDVGNKVWDCVVDKPITGMTSWVAKKALPQGVIDILSYLVHPFGWVYNKVSGKGKAQEIHIWERIRDIVVLGMWSVLLPACLALLSAYLLVWEVEFIQVNNDHNYSSNGPDQLSRIVKQIMIGGGKLSFSMPYHPLIFGTSQVLV